MAAGTPSRMLFSALLTSVVLTICTNANSSWPASSTFHSSVCTFVTIKIDMTAGHLFTPQYAKTSMLWMRASAVESLARQCDAPSNPCTAPNSATLGVKIVGANRKWRENILALIREDTEARGLKVSTFMSDTEEGNYIQDQIETTQCKWVALVRLDSDDVLGDKFFSYLSNVARKLETTRTRSRKSWLGAVVGTSALPNVDIGMSKCQANAPHEFLLSGQSLGQTIMLRSQLWSNLDLRTAVQTNSKGNHVNVLPYFQSTIAHHVRLLDNFTSYQKTHKGAGGRLLSPRLAKIVWKNPLGAELVEESLFADVMQGILEDEDMSCVKRVDTMADNFGPAGLYFRTPLSGHFPWLDLASLPGCTAQQQNIIQEAYSFPLVGYLDAASRIFDNKRTGISVEDACISNFYFGKAQADVYKTNLNHFVRRKRLLNKLSHEHNLRDTGVECQKYAALFRATTGTVGMEATEMRQVMLAPQESGIKLVLNLTLPEQPRPATAVSTYSAPPESADCRSKGRCTPACCAAVCRSTLHQPCCGERSTGTTVLPLLVTGTPRSGTVFVYELLKRLGLSLSNDWGLPKSDGVVSWQHLFAEDDDRNHPGAQVRYPYLGNDRFLNGTRFRMAVHQVRDPLKSIISMCDEPREHAPYKDQYWQNVRRHISLPEASLGLPLDMQEAVESSSLRLRMHFWYGWHSFIDSLGLFRYRVEDLDEASTSTRILQHIFQLIGRAPPSEVEVLAALGKVPGDTNTRKKVASGIANTTGIFNTTDPSWDTLFCTDARLASQIWNLGASYGYTWTYNPHVPRNCSARSTLSCEWILQSKYGGTKKRRTKNRKQETTQLVMIAV